MISFILYVMTLAPTALPDDPPTLEDSVMLQMQAAVLGITHPTGYPTWTMLTHLFTYLPLGDVAYRTNLASAFYAAFAVSALYVAGLLLTQRIVAAVSGALALAVSGIFWSQAVIAEVYTLNAVFITLTIIALLLWRELQRDGYLLLSAFFIGLAMTSHMTSGLLLPAGVFFVAVLDWRKLVEWRLLLKGSGAFLAGLSPYLYLPIRAAMDPPFDGNNPTNFSQFWYIVSGGNLRGKLFAFGPAELPSRLELYWRHLDHDYNWVLLAAACVGLASLIRRNRPVATLTGFLFFGWFFYALERNISDIDVYFIPTYLMFSLWISCGAGIALQGAEALASRFSRVPKMVSLAVLSLALMLIPFAGIDETYAQNDMSHDYRARRIMDNVATEAAPNATVLQLRSNLWYMVLVEKRRRDLTLVDTFYHHNPNIRYADLVWPADISLQAENRRYGTNDLTGVKAAKIAARRGPVYILAWKHTRFHPFRTAGFRVVHDKGSLYELVPPGRKPYTNK